MPCLRKGNKQRSNALEKLCELLNEDPEVKTACNIPLKESTVKIGLDKQAQEIAGAGNKVKQQAAAHGGEKLSGSLSKTKADWMDAFSQFTKSIELVEPARKATKSNLKLKFSVAAEHMFAVASKACGAAHQQAVHKSHFTF